MTNQMFYRLMAAVVVITALLAIFAHSAWAWVAVVAGVHAFQHTYTKFCPLQKILKKGGNKEDTCEGCEKGCEKCEKK